MLSPSNFKQHFIPVTISFGSGCPIRVALLTPTLLMGGAERWLISLARCCDRRRVEWTGIALSHGAAVHPDLCREMAAYMPVYAGPESDPSPCPDSIRRCPSAHAALQNVLKEADVLLTWGLPKLHELVQDYYRPVVLVSHGGGEWARWTVRSSEAGATHLAAVSETACLAFSPMLRSYVTVLHNGIDVQRCTPLIPRQAMRAAWGIAEHQRLIGYVGRYSPEKNPTAAARAAKYLGGNYHAVYVGSGWQETEVRRQVQQIAGARARFRPMDRQVGNVLSALDVFVLASPAEGFSLALTEAWYCGVPVVATRVGAIPELERLHGPLVAPVNINPSPAELARAVKQALTPTFHAEVVLRAREIVAQHFTAGAMGQRWTNYLSAICSGERHGSRDQPSHPYEPGR